MRTKMIACVREVRERNLLWRMVRVDDTSVNIKRLTIRPTEPPIGYFLRKTSSYI